MNRWAPIAIAMVGGIMAATLTTVGAVIFRRKRAAARAAAAEAAFEAEATGQKE